MGMDLPFLASTPTISAKTNKSPGVISPEIMQEKSLLWIGQPNQSIPQPLQQFQFCYASTIEIANEFIFHMLNTLREVPAAIIFEFDSSKEASLTYWENYFRSNQILRTIPFFLKVDEFRDEYKQYIEKYSFIDEFITEDCMENNLVSKISFVGKFKRLNAITRKESNLREKAVSIKRKLSRFSKRTLDVTVAGTALVVLSPVMLIIAALVKAGSKGPIFYGAPRAGKNYHVFKFYKFRTMVVDADKQLEKLKHLNQYDNGDAGGVVFYKVSNDPRITKLGNFLRNSSLDELPQLFNVLKGDMSLVGNRPLPLYESSVLTTDNFAERFLAPAGITGLWQISKRGKKDMSVHERIELDISYSKRNGLRYDMWIMVNTPLALIQKDNV